jgi:hypothetical protein
MQTMTVGQLKEALEEFKDNASIYAVQSKSQQDIFYAIPEGCLSQTSDPEDEDNFDVVQIEMDQTSYAVKK